MFVVVVVVVKDECSRFGVRALPKKKMVAKLTEIYDYTHPIIGKRGISLFISVTLWTLLGSVLDREVSSL